MRKLPPIFLRIHRVSVTKKQLTEVGTRFTMRALLRVQLHSALAQLVEQLTVNQWVAGSSPAGGAIQNKGLALKR